MNTKRRTVMGFFVIYLIYIFIFFTSVKFVHLSIIQNKHFFPKFPLQFSTSRKRSYSLTAWKLPKCWWRKVLMVDGGPLSSPLRSSPLDSPLQPSPSLISSPPLPPHSTPLTSPPPSAAFADHHARWTVWGTPDTNSKDSWHGGVKAGVAICASTHLSSICSSI